MSAPIETMAWLGREYRDRAEADPAEHTTQDAAQVTAASESFGDVLKALKGLVRGLDEGLIGPVPPYRDPDVAVPIKAARVAILKAEGR